MIESDEIAGALSERVILERWQGSRDDAADAVGGWVRVDELFAAVVPDGPAAPRTGGDASRSGRRWRVLVRQRPDIDLSARLRWRDQLLEVLAVDVIGPRRDRVQLLCQGRPA